MYLIISCLSLLEWCNNISFCFLSSLLPLSPSFPWEHTPLSFVNVLAACACLCFHHKPYAFLFSSDRFFLIFVSLASDTYLVDILINTHYCSFLCHVFCTHIYDRIWLFDHLALLNKNLFIRLFFWAWVNKRKTLT